MISLYREGLITFGCPRVYDIVLYGRPDGTSLKVLFLPAVRTHWGEGLVQIRVTGNPISSTLNGQIDNIFP